MTIGSGPYDGETQYRTTFTPESLAKDLNLTFDEVKGERGVIIRKWNEGTALVPVFLSWSWHRNDDEYFIDTLTLRIDGCDRPNKFRWDLAYELSEQMYLTLTNNNDGK
jgi:hypothetical protein